MRVCVCVCVCVWAETCSILNKGPYIPVKYEFVCLLFTQDAVNSKASGSALANVDRCLRALGREMVGLGHAPIGGQHGLLHGTTIGT